MPFDKALIAIGSENLIMKGGFQNVFGLNNLIDHANIHNHLVRKDYNNFVVIGHTLRAIEIASSMRKYLDAIGKEKARVSIVMSKLWAVEELGDEDCARILENYLMRNRIIVFRGVNMNVRPSSDNKRIESVILTHKDNDYILPVSMIAFDMGISTQSRLDFMKNLYIPTDEDDMYSVYNMNVLIPDGRYSLHTSNRYPFVFAAGNVAATRSQYSQVELVRTNNVKANFHLGYLSALSMLDFHYPFDDIIVDSAKVLDKWIHHVGNNTFKNKLIYKNYEKNHFISYLFNGDKVEGMLVFGFKNIHIFMKEALKMEAVPNMNFVAKLLAKTHLYIVQEVMKRQDGIECYKHQAFNETTTTNTKPYSIEDQAYSNNLMKRSVVAYKYYRDKLDKKGDELKQKREEEEKKREEDQRLERIKTESNSESEKAK
jgi:hypothetical protein